MSTGKLTMSHVQGLIKMYIDRPDRREEIILSVWSSGGKENIKKLAQGIGVESRKIIDWLEEYIRGRIKWRRKHRRKNTYIHSVSPPVPIIKTSNSNDVADPKVKEFVDETEALSPDEEAAEIAEMVAGGHGGEQRYGRRNTLSSTVKNRARKF